jgi:serine phosphatase RsbU (regulator of sigma subunit)
VTIDLHSLLRRQLRRAEAEWSAPPAPAAWQELLGSISRAYKASDDDRYTLERSLDLTSAEMKALYDRLSGEHDRLERELEIARTLQLALLPRNVSPSYLELAGKTQPATEAGGDYYDVAPVGDACWIAIGDVTGHGLRAAIVMLMVQSMVAALVRASPAASPSEMLALVNQGLWDGVRNRLAIDDHVTCTLLRCTPTGRVQFAGAHETILVSRRDRPCEQIATTGTWLGVTADVAGINVDRELVLERGDLLVLHTDGIIEARDANDQELGIDRLAALVDSARDRAPAELCDQVFRAPASWPAAPHDDLTMVAARYVG